MLFSMAAQETNIPLSDPWTATTTTARILMEELMKLIKMFCIMISLVVIDFICLSELTKLFPLTWGDTLTYTSIKWNLKIQISLQFKGHGILWDAEYLDFQDTKNQSNDVMLRY